MLEVAMTPTLEEILRTRRVCAPDGTKISLDYEITVSEGEKLQELIIDKRPIVSLEVGLGYGISALFICEAMSKIGGKRHILIDPDPWHQGAGLHNLRKSGFGSLVDFRQHESQVALPQILAEGTRIDFAFIDGWHTFDHVLVDFFYIDKMLRVGGVVAFDDAHQSAVHQVCRFVATNRAYRVCAVVGGTPFKRLGARIARWGAGHSQLLRRLMHNRISETDESLGFFWNSRFIAFEKLSDDTRRWDFHREF
jgi:predicted O-methyltransferase YrrM